MRLTLGNATCRAEGTSEEISWLREYLTCWTRGSREDPPRRVDLLDANDEFPAGNWPQVAAALRPSAELFDRPLFPLEVVDARVAPCQPDRSFDVSFLRSHPSVEGPVDFQMKAVDKLLLKRRGVLWSPTGSGKSTMIAGLCQLLRCRWLLLAPDPGLATQLAGAIKRFTGEEPGLIGAGAWDDTRRLTCCSYRSVAAALSGRSQAKRRTALDLLRSAEALAVDECHMIGAEGFGRVALATPNAYWRFGFSATPLDRSDHKGATVIGCTAPVVHRILTRDLVELGVLSKAVTRVVPCLQAGGGGSFERVYRELVVQSDARNGVIGRIAAVARRPGFVFVERVEHGETLAASLRGLGLRCRFVWGKVAQAERRGVVADLLGGSLDFVVCSAVFRQGIDVPALGSVVNAAGMKSVIATLQRRGRGTRTDAATGKDEFELWDVLDRGNSWLERHSADRIAAYREEGDDVSVIPELSVPAGEPVPEWREFPSALEREREDRRELRAATLELTGRESLGRR